MLARTSLLAVLFCDAQSSRLFACLPWLARAPAPVRTASPRAATLRALTHSDRASLLPSCTPGLRALLDQLGSDAGRCKYLELESLDFGDRTTLRDIWSYSMRN